MDSRNLGKEHGAEGMAGAKSLVWTYQSPPLQLGVRLILYNLFNMHGGKGRMDIGEIKCQWDTHFIVKNVLF